MSDVRTLLLGPLLLLFIFGPAYGALETDADSSGGQKKRQDADASTPGFDQLSSLQAGSQSELQGNDKNTKKKEEASQPNPNQFTPDSRTVDGLMNPDRSLADTPAPLENGTPDDASVANGGWGIVGSASTDNLAPPVDLTGVGSFGGDIGPSPSEFTPPPDPGYTPTMCQSMGYGTGCAPI